MSEDLYESGFKSQVNVDFSPVVIKQMQGKYESKAGMECMSTRALLGIIFSQANEH